MNAVFILHAHRTDFEHKFIEIFTTEKALNNFLDNHSNVVKIEVTYHEVDPV